MIFFFFLNIGPKGAKHGTGCETKAQAVPARMALGSPAGPMGTSHLGCGPCLDGPPTRFFFFFAIGALLAEKKPKASVHRWKKNIKNMEKQRKSLGVCRCHCTRQKDHPNWYVALQEKEYRSRSCGQKCRHLSLRYRC